MDRLSLVKIPYIGGGGGGGTVTSVGLIAPTDLFNVLGSPVTTAGDLELELASHNVTNLVFATSVNDAPAAPSFRSLVASDLPISSMLSDPIAQVSLITVNGSSNTFMRSDAAPSIDQSISPTWTGTHVFKNTGGRTVWIANTAASAISFTDNSGNISGEYGYIIAQPPDFFVGSNSSVNLHLRSGGGSPVIVTATGMTITSLVGTGSRFVIADNTGFLTATSSIPLVGSSPSLDLPLGIAAGGTVDLGFNITGAAIGDVVALGIPAAAQVGGLIVTAFVSNTNVVTIRFYNSTPSPIASIAAGIYKATVFKF